MYYFTVIKCLRYNQRLNSVVYINSHLINESKYRTSDTPFTRIKMMDLTVFYLTTDKEYSR